MFHIHSWFLFYPYLYWQRFSFCKVVTLCGLPRALYLLEMSSYPCFFMSCRSPSPQLSFACSSPEAPCSTPLPLLPSVAMESLAVYHPSLVRVPRAWALKVSANHLRSLESWKTTPSPDPKIWVEATAIPCLYFPICKGLQ